ncbi:hypothetical protein DFJ67_4091 [Asanoa ferruginea]|uniref:Uncharacterized protein n=1 Tax=Asanoa ferruginea TaxID=53367 RepID=A0A3D9ZLJ7_9ACTN|nr:hypothetical protein [Asanoa ferruginea]REF98081.1 hypothetical protein DFJ67_4091 [Asanoa ferruginea]GIF49625.1 hypothetical protein Afe04nite_41640 [Asanoa ferruginea]
MSRDRVAKIMLWLAAAGAAGAALSSAGALWDADGGAKVVETWRAYGFVVFAGLFVLLALAPRGYRGVWELVIFHKVALTVTALLYAAHGGIADTATIVAWDGSVSVLLVGAYVLSRGWTASPAWRRTTPSAG